jgi:hypothetical protein
LCLTAKVLADAVVEVSSLTSLIDVLLADVVRV